MNKCLFAGQDHRIESRSTPQLPCKFLSKFKCSVLGHALNVEVFFILVYQVLRATDRFINVDTISHRITLYGVIFQLLARGIN